MTTTRIVFDRVWKKFYRGEMHDSLRDLLPAVARRLFGRAESELELREGDFWAVKDLSFEVMPGQCLGIIGPNGSGKSTTLKLLTRILEATRGRCEMHGRVGSLIEVSAGFHGDLTGRENVYLQGAIMGMSRTDIVRKFDEIVQFSGVSEFIDTPVKRYSSGMNARLGFSIAAHLEPEVLIIDEVLSVGDMSFQERAFGRIRDLAKSGIPVVIVSHQLERIAELCTEAILLNSGSPIARGTPGEAIAAYIRTQDTVRASQKTGAIDYLGLEMPSDEVVSGERLVFTVEGRINTPVADSVEPLLIRVRSLVTGQSVYSTGSRMLGIDLTRIGPLRARVELQANLPPGSYLIEVVAYDRATRFDVAMLPSTLFWVRDAGTFRGSVQLNAAVVVEEITAK